MESAIERLEAIKLPVRPLYNSYNNVGHCKTILTNLGYNALSSNTFEELANYMGTYRSGKISLKNLDSALTPYQIGRVNAMLLDFLESKGVNNDDLNSLSSIYHYIDRSGNEVMPASVFSDELKKAPPPQSIPLAPVNETTERTDLGEREFGWLVNSLPTVNDVSRLEHTKQEVRSALCWFQKITKK